MDRSSWYRRPDWAGHFHSGQPQAGAGVAVRNLPSGPVLESLPDAFLRRGKSTNPYQVGTLGYACNPDGVDNGQGGQAFITLNGYYGGSTDTQANSSTSTVTTAKVDTWHRDRANFGLLRDLAGQPTYGVSLYVITRVYDSATGSGTINRYEWGRYFQWDSRGWLVSISVEYLKVSELISGSGSAGGGI